MKTLLTILLLSSSLFAAKGIVSVKLEDCDYFMVYVGTTDDYSVMEWMGGYEPDKGDLLYGTFNSYGSHNLYYGDRKTNVYIEEYGLDRGDALEQLYEQCD